jgi:hypothetical protein
MPNIADGQDSTFFVRDYVGLGQTEQQDGTKDVPVVLDPPAIADGPTTDDA